jgi:phosphatidylserine decarboxylase
MSTENDQQPRSAAGHLAHLKDLAKNTIPPMHPAGRPVVAVAAAITLLIRRRWHTAGLIAAIVTAWCAWFFREPRRVTPARRGIAVAPADGTIAAIEPAAAPAELDPGSAPLTRVSIFLSLFDVHVQRIPINGVVRRVVYRRGAFLSADLDKASEANERNSVLLRDSDGRDVIVVQIAGLIARRIVCSIRAGDTATAGSTYGLIRFGSRVDLYVPAESTILVERGQRAVGGETVLAELPGPAGN